MRQDIFNWRPVRSIATRERIPGVPRPPTNDESDERRGIPVYLGTMPDYGTDTTGVRIVGAGPTATILDRHWTGAGGEIFALHDADGPPQACVTSHCIRVCG